MRGPLLTKPVHDGLIAAARAGESNVLCSLDLERSTVAVDVSADGWIWQSRRFPFLESCKERTIYYWSDGAFQPVARFTTSLIKLVPTPWGAPTFEIDGIKMLPSEHVSPWTDAERKVAMIQPRDKVVLDTCGGLGYLAAWCLAGHAKQIFSYEKNPDVFWLRDLNPWSPQAGGPLSLMQADVTQEIASVPDASIDAVLHDPPRFGIAGELYSQIFYDQLARVLKRKGRLFHYTGTPNKLTTGRDVPREVAARLQRADFTTKIAADGVLAMKR